MPVAVIIAAIFIGLYFYRSANNIGKNGALWVGIALGTFIAINVLVNLVFYFLFVSSVSDSQASGYALGVFAGLGAGIIGLFVVNYYMNIIPD
jgi:hypothetical protein